MTTKLDRTAPHWTWTQFKQKHLNYTFYSFKV